MKKIKFYGILMMLLCLFAADARTEAQAQSILQKGHIVFYSQATCHYCKEALGYIKKVHPDLKMEIVEIDTKDGYDRFRSQARRFGLREIGTPFIVLGGDDYLMGWGDDNAAKFTHYVDRLNK